MSDKYIKLKVSYRGRSGEIVNYQVLETKNIDFVEPGYVYEVERPKTFKSAFDDGYWDGIDVHLILE